MAKKILLIDDDRLVVKSIERYLKTYGYDVETVQSGREALEKAEKSEFDLIISDIRMPEMDGVETLRRIRELSLQHNKQKTPAIVITGYAGGDEVYRKAGELGIADCVYKPFELDEFIEVIKRNLILPPKYREISFEYKLLDSEFVSLTKEMGEFLQDIKEKFDKFDRLNSSEQRQIDLIKINKKKIFDRLDKFFAKAWSIVKNFERDRYIIHQNHYQQTLGYLLLDLIETNRHVYRKPLGYSGDYIMMEYIYNYSGDHDYLGSSSYEKLFNNYTCNIPISCSTFHRKRFLKEKIVETLGKKDKAKILSVGCGSATELIELLNEGKVIKPILFTCLDSEKKVLDYIESRVRKIEMEKKQFFSMEYLCRDITSIIRDENLKNKLKDCDLVYAFGIFDYLSDRMAKRLTKELYQLLQKESNLIICNVSSENSSHRAYYELLGGWNMVHRTKEEMLAWTEDIKDMAEIKFEYPPNLTNHLSLNIKKL